jgi:hypothetical protein
VEQRVATHRLFLSVFRSWWDNLIVLGRLSTEEQARLQREGVLPSIVRPGIAQYANVAEIDNYGVSGSWNGSLFADTLRFGVTATEAFTRRRVGAASEPLAVAPQFFGNLRIAVVLAEPFPTPAFALSYIGERPADRALVAGERAPEVPGLAQMRVTLSGAVPGLRELRYRLSAAAATRERGAYTAGPNIDFENTGFGGSAGPYGFAPVDQFSAFVGLNYEFGSGETP